MKTKIIILVYVSLVFSSCKLILGIKEPKELTINKLIEYQLKNKIDTSNSFLFSKYSFDSLSLTSYKPKWPIGFRPLQFKIFNSEGNLISQYSTCEGSLNKLKILQHYPPSNWYYFDSSSTFVKELKMLRKFNGEIVMIDPSENDLNIILYWGTWLGIPGKKIKKKITNYQKKYIDKKIRIYYVNVGEIYK